LAIGADSVRDVHIQRNLERPACVGLRIAGSSRLVDSFETAVRGCARGKTEMSAIHAEIALDVRVIVGINDPYSLDFAGRRRKAISGPELHRAITTGRCSSSRNTATVCNNTCVAAAGAKRSWPRA